jgi:EAL domain-containing protein (putative c-di-GMP-specific phosphodiesterase class I)
VLRVGFNASAELLARDDVVDLVLATLARRGLPGEALMCSAFRAPAG